MELAELKGVGDATYAKLESLGIETLPDLAQTEAEELEEQFSSSKASKLVSRAQRAAVVIQDAGDAKAEDQAKTYYTTGMDALNDVLGGGWLEGDIAGIAGPSSTGKTQLTFKSIGEAVAQTEEPAIYIETERGRFNAERIAAVSSATPDQVEERVYRVKAYSLDQQLEAYRAVAEHFDAVSIMAVDSFTSRFRLSEKFEGRGTLSQRSTEFARHLRAIETTVDRLECVALLTLQIYGNPQQYGSNSVTYGGELLRHTLSYTIKMGESQGQFKEAALRGHSGRPDDHVLMAIGDDGIEAHRE